MIPRPYHGIDLKTLPDLQLYKLNPASYDSQTISWHRSKTLPDPQLYKLNPASHDPQTISWHRSKNTTRH
ncbi:hypothetical protein DPMN_108372 [Dreissena polymorpha]|uniref:Uncharacterized protein n=1 Tax=Dreissena polymorpha TaxID=45954 RepID=A0A9D4QL43_DREPO|nr:hypothetical protein DPMN_108372 [Dreissena polymorpha]